MDTQTGAATGLFGLSLDTLKLSQALIRNGEALSSRLAAGSHWTVLCAGTKRLEALRSAFAAAPENQRSLLIRKLAADLDHRLKLSAEVKWLGFVPPLYRRALARTLRWRCDIHASALRHLARE